MKHKTVGLPVWLGLTSDTKTRPAYHPTSH